MRPECKSPAGAVPGIPVSQPAQDPAQEQHAYHEYNRKQELLPVLGIYADKPHSE
jgi:hypothetical protein